MDLTNAADGWQCAYADVNLEYGGKFFRVHDDWAEFVEVIDLDGACGFSGAILIETGSVPVPRLWGPYADPARAFGTFRSAISCVGGLPDNWQEMDRDAKRLWLVDALHSYGWRDVDGAWSGSPERVYQLDPEGELTFDGWTAERLTFEEGAEHEDLESFVLSEFLSN